MYSRGLLITMLLGWLAGETAGKGPGDAPARPGPARMGMKGAAQPGEQTHLSGTALL